MKINLSRLLGSDKDTALDRAWRHLEEGLKVSRGAILTGQILSRREKAKLDGDELRQGELFEIAKENPKPALDKGYGR